MTGAALVAAGFADFPLIAYHFTKTSSVPKDLVPVAYAIAMGVSGTGSLVLGACSIDSASSCLSHLQSLLRHLRRSCFWANSGPR